ncbi:MAG: protein phosphatase 2C domain-containing protein [Proteobacteria bacterium]|nr:protein phosphatase 2C domain-containing protein [Pseudomonadota bacterium]
MGDKAPARLVLVDQDMEVETLLPFAGGCAAVYSARAPDRDGANEDGALVAAFDASSGVLAVADGLGGRPAGENASELTLQRLADAVTRTGGPSRSAVLDGIERANEAVMALGIGAATTLSVAEIARDRLRPYQVGDSAILVVGQRGVVKLQTLSHSPVGYALESGLLDEKDALHHEQRHLISNMVGAADMRIDVGSTIRLAPRDTVLLATDGLLDNLSQAEMIDRICTGPLSEAARRLASVCAHRMRTPSNGHPSKPDDLTFILYRPTA